MIPSNNALVRLGKQERLAITRVKSGENLVETKSPVPDPTLPQPGESSWEIMEDRWYNRVMTPLIISSLMAMMAAAQWLDTFYKPAPWFWTIVFVVSALFTAWRYRGTLPELKQRAQGVRGERTVGQLLEQLRSLGCKVYHAIEEDGYNIDHVIIGPYGVFAVETKAPSKPSKGQSSVIYDGENVKGGPHKPDPAPVIQARAAARRVRAILREMTGDEPPVTPVLLFVNWFVKTCTADISTIVMNQTYFWKSFGDLHDENSLPMARVNSLAAGIERYLREKRK
jgi:hypothetical protein